MVCKIATFFHSGLNVKNFGGKESPLWKTYVGKHGIGIAITKCSDYRWDAANEIMAYLTTLLIR